MPPIHADEVDGATGAVTGQQPHARSKERDELRFRHLAARHLKLAMPNRAVAADVAVDRHVVRRIDENYIRSLCSQQFQVRILFERVRTENAVSAQLP